MADITLGDYTGYILLEMIKAREMADQYSRTVAERYAQDPVMKFFSVPRFKVPKMNLTIPVLISGASFQQTVRLDLPVDEFISAIVGRANEVRSTVAMKRDGFDGRTESVAAPPPPRPTNGETDLAGLARQFRDQLIANPEPQRPESIVTVAWAGIFKAVLEDGQLLDFYAQWDPQHNLLTRTTEDVLALVRSRTVVDSTAIQSLLVNPETNVVKNGSSDATVFTVNAELLEEGFFIRSVRDDETQTVRPIVEFD